MGEGFVFGGRFAASFPMPVEVIRAFSLRPRERAAPESFDAGTVALESPPGGLIGLLGESAAREDCAAVKGAAATTGFRNDHRA